MSSTCTTVDEFLECIRVSVADKDIECLHWEDSDLIKHINEGLNMLLMADPGIFSEDVSITLSEGSCQELPQPYLELVKIKSNVSVASSGQEIEGDSIQEADYDLISSFSKPSCVDKLSNNKAHTISSYGMSTVNKTSFNVSPAVPAGSSATVKATVVTSPCSFNNNNRTECLGIDPRYQPALMEWVLYRALTADFESNRNTELGTRHAQTFYAMMGLTYLQESRLNSGYYKGEPGEDPRLSYRWNR